MLVPVLRSGCADVIPSLRVNGFSNIALAFTIFVCAGGPEDVDKTAVLVAKLGATIIRGPEERDWAAGYYYVLFEDPDGIRFEVNFIPGAGLLKKDEGFGSSEDYIRVDGQDMKKPANSKP